MINPAKWFKDPIIGSTVIIAVATVVNLLVSVGLWVEISKAVDVTSQIYLAANLPYLGLNTYDVVMQNNAIIVSAAIKNFGTAPAIQADIRTSMSVDGTVAEGIGGDEAKPLTIFPTMMIRRAWIIGTGVEEVLKGSSIAQFTV